jgi:hypothetical protein
MRPERNALTGKRGLAAAIQGAETARRRLLPVLLAARRRAPSAPHGGGHGQGVSPTRRRAGHGAASRERKCIPALDLTCQPASPEPFPLAERSPDTVGIRQPAPDVAAEDIGRAAMRLRSSGGGHPRSQGRNCAAESSSALRGTSVRAGIRLVSPWVPHGRAPNSGTGDTVSAHPDASPSRAAGQRASFDYDAFISYTHHDRPVAAGIQKWMRRRQRSGPRVSQRSAPTSTFWAGVGVDLVSLSTARTESSS